MLISRSTNNHTFFQTQLKQRGFPKVTVTSVDKDGLNFVINDLKPRLVIIGAGFYYCSTAYMMSLLLKKFPELNIAAVSIAPYPASLAMWFIFNGVKSYINFDDGADDFFKGLESIRDGRKYISQSVQERIELCRERPLPASQITPRQLEVIKLLCNGFNVPEIGDVLHITKSTVDRHKADIYQNLNVRNENELIGRAITLGMVKVDELIFHPKNYELKPKPERKLLSNSKPMIRRVK